MVFGKRSELNILMQFRFKPDDFLNFSSGFESASVRADTEDISTYSMTRLISGGIGETTNGYKLIRRNGEMEFLFKLAYKCGFRALARFRLASGLHKVKRAALPH
ncbi:hypothetical protein CISECK367B_23445 [Citrobacter sedlakii]